MNPRDMALPGLNLHPLTGDRKRIWSVKVSGNLLNCQTGISPKMAVRLAIAFDTTAESWMNQQLQYDLWQAKQHRDELHVTRLTVGQEAA